MISTVEEAKRRARLQDHADSAHAEQLASAREVKRQFWPREYERLMKQRNAARRAAEDRGLPFMLSDEPPTTCPSWYLADVTVAPVTISAEPVTNALGQRIGTATKPAKAEPSPNQFFGDAP